MELKKCARCGCFYLSESNVCENCKAKDANEMFRLKSYIEENEITDLAVEQLSIKTEISAKNVYRYLSQPEFQNSIPKGKGSHNSL